MDSTLVGQTVSHYRIVEKIGAGGMGEVYRAQDERLERDVALKVLPPGSLVDEAGRKRFRKEALTLSKLNHPNIATIHDFDAHAGVDFLVMEYVAGETLGERLRAGPLAEEEIARLGVELAEGLAAAHGEGVIHRDLKPGNVRLTPDGRLKILDFGLAKLVKQPSVAAGSAPETVSASESGAVAGTLPYMAPEQLRGDLVDARSDIWAAGLVLYELATGQRAFSGTDSARLITAILQDAPPPASEVNPRVSPGLAGIISKCLERDPESRYQSAGELAVDLRRLGMPSPRWDKGARRARGRLWVVAAAATLTVLAAGMLAWIEGWLPTPHRQPQAPVRKEWILVAEFDGPPEDSSLAGTTRELLSAALDQSQLVATVPREQIRLALEKAGKPTNTRVDAGLARELAYRSAVRTVLEGKIGRLGLGYLVVLRVVDAESLRVVLTERAVAKDENSLIPTLGRLAEKLRADLGEERSALEAARPLDDAATPSFEAYRLYVQAVRMIRSISSREAIPVLRDALALDADFASAWSALGIAFYNLNQFDSSLAAYDEALRRPHRLTAVQRLKLEANRAMISGDQRAALAACQHALRYDPADISALVTAGIVFGNLGRFEEALESTLRAEDAGPYGANQVLLWNEVLCLARLGRLDEARAVARQLQRPMAQRARTHVEIVAGNWAAAESIAATLAEDPALSSDQRTAALLNLGSAQAARGAIRAAVATLERAEEVAQGAPESMGDQDAARRGRLMLATMSGGAVPLPRDTWAGDTTTATLITRGLRAAVAGDRAGAERLWSAVRARGRGELRWQGAAPTLLEARIHGLAGRWGDAARVLQPIASQRREFGPVVAPVGMSAVRWFLADVLEALGHPDSAAIWLERVVSDPAAAFRESEFRGIAVPFAHRRLALLYARMSRVQDASRHWRVFSQTFVAPDPEVKPLIEEARAAQAGAKEATQARGGSP
jgi:tetratricopeptide (TPR) repeat protein